MRGRSCRMLPPNEPGTLIGIDVDFSSSMRAVIPGMFLEFYLSIFLIILLAGYPLQAFTPGFSKKIKDIGCRLVVVHKYVSWPKTDGSVTITDLGKVLKLEVCVELCCEAPKCDWAIFHSGQCYQASSTGGNFSSHLADGNNLGTGSTSIVVLERISKKAHVIISASDEKAVDDDASEARTSSLLSNEETGLGTSRLDRIVQQESEYLRNKIISRNLENKEELLSRIEGIANKRFNIPKSVKSSPTMTKAKDDGIKLSTEENDGEGSKATSKTDNADPGDHETERDHLIRPDADTAGTELESSHEQDMKRRTPNSKENTKALVIGVSTCLAVMGIIFGVLVAMKYWRKRSQVNSD